MAARKLTISLMLLVTLAGCGKAQDLLAPGASAMPAGDRVPTSVAARPLAQPQPCTGSFIAHTLDYSIALHGDTVHLFDSNGSGVAIDDLDGDGRLDIVFTHRVAGVSYWRNTGRLSSAHPPSPAAAGEGGDSSPALSSRPETSEAQRAGWTGDGRQTFVREALPGVLAPAYAMAGWRGAL